jgi:hypothetical protein
MQDRSGMAITGTANQGDYRALALHQIAALTNVCFRGKADIQRIRRDVRF